MHARNYGVGVTRTSPTSTVEQNTVRFASDVITCGGAARRFPSVVSVDGQKGGVAPRHPAPARLVRKPGGCGPQPGVSTGSRKGSVESRFLERQGARVAKESQLRGDGTSGGRPRAGSRRQAPRGHPRYANREASHLRPDLQEGTLLPAGRPR